MSSQNFLMSMGEGIRITLLLSYTHDGNFVFIKTQVESMPSNSDTQVRTPFVIHLMPPSKMPQSSLTNENKSLRYWIPLPSTVVHRLNHISSTSLRFPS